MMQSYVNKKTNAEGKAKADRRFLRSDGVVVHPDSYDTYGKPKLNDVKQMHENKVDDDSFITYFGFVYDYYVQKIIEIFA